MRLNKQATKTLPTTKVQIVLNPSWNVCGWVALHPSANIESPFLSLKGSVTKQVFNIVIAFGNMEESVVKLLMSCLGPAVTADVYRRHYRSFPRSINKISTGGNFSASNRRRRRQTCPLLSLIIGG
jgi:hypothetical protein